MKTVVLIQADSREREIEIEKMRDDIYATINGLVKKYGDNRNGFMLSLFSMSCAAALCSGNIDPETVNDILEANNLTKKL